MASIVNKLAAREIHGSYCTKIGKIPRKLFTKIPGRMCYKLESLVPLAILESGHVFLGFCKSGQFILSYSLYLDAEWNTAYPIYVYKLQWWQFFPPTPLQLVSEVRLFGEEDITQDLFIVLCEWPQDDEKIVVYGHRCAHADIFGSAPGVMDDTCQCYMTVTAMPSLGLCKYCHQLAQKGFFANNSSFQKCIIHSYSVHTKFDLAPPFPIFLPRVQLKADGIVVINTGDSIVAFQVDTSLPSHSCNQVEGCSSHTVTDSKLSNSVISNKFFLGANLSIFGTMTKFYSQESSDHELLENSSKRHQQMLESCHEIPLSFSDAWDNENFYSSELSQHSDGNQPGLCNGLCNENSLVFCEKCNDYYMPDSHCSCSSLLLMGGCRPALRTKRNTAVDNSENIGNGHEVCSHKIADFECTSSRSPKSPKNLSGHLDVSSRHLSAHCIGCHDKNTSQFETGYPAAHYTVNSPQSSLLHSPTFKRCIGAHRQTSMDGDLSYSAHVPSSHHSFFSPSNSSEDCLSQSSESIIVHTNYAHTLTFSIRRFALAPEQLSDPQPSVEDESDLAYHSMLPVQVMWRGKSLNIVRTVETGTPLVTVLQMTFDIEHYMVEAIRSEAEWGQRYVAFYNYDLRVLDIFLDHPLHVIIQSLRTGKLNIGLYTTLHIDELMEADDELLQGRDWNPGSRECCLLRRSVAIPQAYFQSVHVLSNEAVLRGKSLNLFMASHLYTAIML